MNISKRIASIREVKGFTQKQIADLLDMEQSNYSRLEGRGSKLTIEQLEKIASALGVSVVELLTGEGENEEIDELKRKLGEYRDHIFKITVEKETENSSMMFWGFYTFNGYMTQFGLKNNLFTEAQYSQLINDVQAIPLNDDDFDTDLFDLLQKKTDLHCVTHLMNEEQIVSAIDELDYVSKELLHLFFNKNMLLDKKLHKTYHKYLALDTLKKIAKQVKDSSK